MYLKIMKKTGSWASEESFVISAGGTTAYTSPTLTNSETRTLEVCLPSSTNSQYSLEMKDSYGDSWTDGGWIELYGINGNMAFKGMMVESRTETHLFSLYSPINKNEDWKYATGAQASGNWKDFNYSDASWTLITLGSATQTASGTQYFRKTFAGITGMAAIDLQLNYRAGVVAYINGVEVFRDNMPDGAVVDTTPAQGSYAFYAYHGVVRPAYVAEATQAVLAVELHSDDRGDDSVQRFLGLQCSRYAGLDLLRYALCCLCHFFRFFECCFCVLVESYIVCFWLHYLHLYYRIHW